MTILFCLSFVIVRAQSDDETETEQEPEGFNFKQDFLNGMESGFFLRNSELGQAEYQCPEVVLTADNDFKKAKEFMGPVKMLIGMLNNKKVDAAWGSIELFIDSIKTLETAANKYEASEFCRGVVFGIHGSRLLFAVGRQLVTVI